MSKKFTILFLCLAVGLVGAGVADAQAEKPEKTGPKVDEEIVKAWQMNTEQAEATAKNPSAKITVRYIALKKLCSGGYDDKKLIPLLMAALGPEMAPHLPIQRLAIIELAKRKHEPAGAMLYMIVINNAADWELRKAAEAGLEQVVPNFPETLKGALLKAENKPGDPPDPKKIEDAVKLYAAQLGPRFGQAAPK
ncbi:MAG: HEAT repeat domain-containing protein [Planctomycetota bacterium]